jgi:NADPH-dependent curcumin reductase CurA
MAESMNKRIVFASYPERVLAEANFRLETAPVPKPADGEVLVKNLWLSLDPYMRFRLIKQKSYAKALEPGEVMTGEAAGEVVESRHPKFRPGDKVCVTSGWQLYWSGKGELLTKVDDTKAPLSYYLGCLGMPGRTAYFGMKDILQPKAGETVVVSAASGAVGSVVGQIGKEWGCRVVGIAGGKSKCDYVVKELGFDACVDYKAGKLLEDLRAACPKGVDAYFDNVGGEIFDTLLRLMNVRSRIAACGRISEAESGAPYGVKNLGVFISSRIKMQGLLVFDWLDRYPEANDALLSLVDSGRFKYRESVVQGLENAPKGLIGLLKGENFGKQLVRLT